MATLAAAAANAALAASAVSAYSSYQSGQSQKKAAKYNEKVMEQQALDAKQRAAVAGAEKKDEARQIAARQAAIASSSGVSATSGTPLALLVETAGLGELDAARTRNNAEREAQGLKAAGKLERYQGKMAARGGALNAAGTFLGGMSSAYSTYKITK